jgi:hypothetical protein
VKIEHADIPAGYEGVTLRELRRLYAGPNALPCPPELLAWLDHAIRLHDIIVREQALREALQ